MTTSIRAIKRRFKKFTTVGKRCHTYGAGCAICESYRFLLERGRFPYSFDEFWDYSLQHESDCQSISWEELTKNPTYAKKRQHENI